MIANLFRGKQADDAASSGPGGSSPSTKAALAHTSAIDDHPAESNPERYAAIPLQPGITDASVQWMHPGPIELTQEEEARAVTLWGWLGNGEMDHTTFTRELAYLEAGLPPCDSCRTRSATINDGGFRICGSCFGVQR